MTDATDPLELAEQVLGHVGGDAETQVRVTRTRHGLTRFANSHIHQHVGEDTTAVELRVTRDGRSVGASTTRTDAEGLRDFASHTVELADAAPVDESWPGLTPGDDTRPDRSDTTAPDATDPDARAEVVAAFVAAGDGLNAAGYCETVDEVVGYANSAGRRRAGRTSRATVDGIHRTDTSAGTAHATSRSLADLDGDDVGRRAAELARRSTDPVDLDPGQYEVVLAPEPVSTIAVFLGIYAFNARAVAEDRSAVTVGADQFDPAITLADDVTDPRATALDFDLEGTDRGRTVLVDAGHVRGLVHNRRTAAAVGVDSTGNHVPGSETWGPVPTNLVLSPGTTDPDALVADVERGIWVAAFNYCRVLDPKTLVVTGLTRNGTFLIEDGRITRPLGNLRFTQSFRDALAPGQVLGVGDDDRYADCEFGPGMVVAPSLRLASWSITGNQAG